MSGSSHRVSAVTLCLPLIVYIESIKQQVPVVIPHYQAHSLSTLSIKQLLLFTTVAVFVLASELKRMSTSSSSSGNSSIDALPLNLRLSDLTRQSAYATPLTSCPDSPNIDLESYFPTGPKSVSARSDAEPTYPKVNSVCFVGAGFVGM